MRMSEDVRYELRIPDRRISSFVGVAGGAEASVRVDEAQASEILERLGDIEDAARIGISQQELEVAWQSIVEQLMDQSWYVHDES